MADRLKNWADEMGYVHRNGSPSDNSADFNKYVPVHVDMILATYLEQGAPQSRGPP